MANLIVAQLLFLESENPDKEFISISTPGGSVTAGLSIYDTMQFIKPDVSTMCIGQRPPWEPSYLQQVPKASATACPMRVL